MVVRRKFSREVKETAIRGMKEGRGVTVIASELKVRTKVLYEWKNALEGWPKSKGRRDGRPTEPVTAKTPGAEERHWQEVAATLALENHFLARALQRSKERRPSSGEVSDKVSGQKSAPNTSSKVD